ncbi:hypothetical protein BFC21_25195 [Pseudomonas sp. TMW 2.1634]|nr:hypothetical protein BFC21_25195 [Pseudomonas sp. TMW 2.1634]ASC88505.1 hypothetical protein CDA60_20175 [Pseudomonas fragi]PAA01818.1 hypothetical protein CJU78_22840 [Pseudomonas fragi]
MCVQVCFTGLLQASKAPSKRRQARFAQPANRLFRWFGGLVALQLRLPGNLPSIDRTDRSSF